MTHTYLKNCQPTKITSYIAHYSFNTFERTRVEIKRIVKAFISTSMGIAAGSLPSLITDKTYIFENN